MSGKMRDQFRSEADAYLRHKIMLPELLDWVNGRIFADADAALRRDMDAVIMLGDEIAEGAADEADLRDLLRSLAAAAKDTKALPARTPTK